MSKIYDELSKATGLTLKRGVDRQDYLFDLVKAIASLKDPEWEALSQAAQKWYNAAADEKNVKKDKLTDFPDLEAEQETSTRRRRSSEEAEPEVKMGVGTKIKGETSRGKVVEGKVVEVDGDTLVIDDGSGGDYIDFNPKTAKSLNIVKDEEPATEGRRRRASADDANEPASYEPKKGDKVTITNKRGKVVTGEIVEITDDLIVVDDGKTDHDFGKDRIESIKPEGASSSRRASSGGDAAPAGEKTKRVSNEGVSIGNRIAELICDDIGAKEEDIAKLLKKEGLDFKDNTLTLNFKSTHKLLDILEAKKMLK